MKKLKLVFLTLFGFFCICGRATTTPQVKVYAEEIVQQEQIINEGEEEIIQEGAIDQKDFEEFKAQVQQWLTQFMDESLVAKVISWLVDAGVLSALFFITVKYRKYKHTTIEDLMGAFKGNIKEYLGENFNQLSAVEIKKITGEIANLENSIETIMKVLVLMQDNTTKGKATLLEYLGSKTDSAEVKKATEEVNVVLAEKQEKEEVIKEKVNGEYQDLF